MKWHLLDVAIAVVVALAAYILCDLITGQSLPAWLMIALLVAALLAAEAATRSKRRGQPRDRSTGGAG